MARTVLAAALLAIAALLLACGSDGGDASADGVLIESVSPASGSLGTEIVITGSGFTAGNNDIGFGDPEPGLSGPRARYLNRISSADGTTLRVHLPDNEDVLLGVCALSQMAPEDVCPLLLLELSTGQTKIFVVNEHGTSNTVPFTVTE